MNRAEPVRRVVVVHGPADPAIERTLAGVGLVAVQQVGDAVIWGPPADPPPSALPSELDGQLLVTIEQAAKVLALGRSTVYELIGRGELPTVHVGRAARVATEDLENLVGRLRAAAAPTGR